MDQSQVLANLYAKHILLSKKIRKSKIKSVLHKHILCLPLELRRDIIRHRFLKKIDNSDIDFSQNTVANNILVSLTSFPARIGVVHLVVKALFFQTIMPEKIILWLSIDEFPNKLEDLPQNLKELQCERFSIEFVEGNIKSHKKYFYAFERFPNYSIVTIDDDLCMPFDTISRLQNLSRNHPTSVCANVAREINIQEGAFDRYKTWEKQVGIPPKQSIMLVAIGYGGVLYPPNCFKNFNFDIKSIFKICPNADDLWLKANELSENISVATGGEEFEHPIIITHTQRHSLQRSNNSTQQQNDIQWMQVCDFFGIKPSRLTNDVTVNY